MSEETGSKNEQPPKTFSFSLDDDSDIKISDEEQRELDRQKTRQELVAPLIIQLFPDQDWPVIVAKEQGISVEELDDEDKGYARRLKRDYTRDREDLSIRLSRSIVVNDNLSDYCRSLYELTSVTTDPNKQVEPRHVLVMCGIAETNEQTQQLMDYAIKWNKEFLEGADDKVRKQRIGRLHEILVGLTGSNIYPRPTAIEHELMNQLFEQLVNSQKFIYEQTTLDNKIERQIENHALTIGIQNRDPQELVRFQHLVLNSSGRVSADVLEKYIDTIASYTRNHGLDDSAVTGFESKLLPLLESKSNEISVVIRGGNIWGMGKGDWGVADFECHCLASRITPESLNEMLMILREVPSTDLGKLEQNRIDGLSLANPFGALRDFIHDQRVGVHKVVSAMVAYYDAKPDEEQYETTLRSSLQAASGYLSSQDRTDLILDRSRYEVIVKETVNGVEQDVRAIDVLRRLQQNTEPIPDLVPVTSDDKLNELMSSVTRFELEDNVIISTEQMHSVIVYINTLLINQMNEQAIGILPNTLIAIGWIEQRTKEMLQSMSYEDQQAAYKQEWFTEIVKLEELLYSREMFDQTDFDRFIISLRESSSPFDAYKLISSRMYPSLRELAEKYKQEGKEERVGTLWSGNLVHELINLTEHKPASTAYGRRHRQERMTPDNLRVTGD